MGDKIIGSKMMGTTDDSDIHGWRTTIERQGGRENEQPKVGPKGEGVGTTESNHTKLHEREKQGGAQGTCASASEPDSLTSKLADSPVSESPSRSASGPASLPATSYSLPPACGVRRLLHQAATAPEAPTPATSYSLPATAPEALTSPSAWFGFRLRAYEGWRDLEKFFPDGEGELKENLKRIFLEKRKFPKTEMLKYQAAGFLLRKWGGLRGRIFGHRVKGCFRATFMTQAELNALMISEEKMQ